MREPTAHTAVYEFEDGAWNVRISGLKGCVTHGRSLRQAQERIREALALWLDVPPDELDVRDRVPGEFSAVSHQVAAARRSAERAAAEAHDVATAAVRTLTERGLSRRDVAELLGLSHQRVQQLLEAS